MNEAKMNPCVSAPQGQTTPIADTISVVQLKTREEVLAAREAFRKGALWRHSKIFAGVGAGGVRDSEHARAAAEKYPMPKITVPREVTYDGMRYRYVSGRFEFKSMVTGQWQRSLTHDVAGLKALLGLIDNPTCEVDA